MFIIPSVFLNLLNELFYRYYIFLWISRFPYSFTHVILYYIGECLLHYLSYFNLKNEV